MGWRKSGSALWLAMVFFWFVAGLRNLVASRIATQSVTENLKDGVAGVLAGRTVRNQKDAGLSIQHSLKILYTLYHCRVAGLLFGKDDPGIVFEFRLLYFIKLNRVHLQQAAQDDCGTTL